MLPDLPVAMGLSDYAANLAELNVAGVHIIAGFKCIA